MPNPSPIEAYVDARIEQEAASKEASDLLAYFEFAAGRLRGEMRQPVLNRRTFPSELEFKQILDRRAAAERAVKAAWEAIPGARRHYIKVPSEG
jgi:hypothetical protein